VARTVVWSGARVAGAVENAIVTEDGLYEV
jgi:hypothetical protein